MKKEQNKNGEKITLDTLYAYLHESSKESDREFKEFRESMKELRESQKETDRQMKELREFQKETALQMQETDKKIREVTGELGGIGNSNGDFAEEYFQNAFLNDPKLNGEIYNRVSFNLNTRSTNGQKQQKDEYDIVLSNEESVAIIEIKYHLRKENMENILSKVLNKIETFKAFFPAYKNHKFYLGIASLSFKKNIEDIILQEGIAVIKQVGGKMVINSENLKVF